jgi:hypothetical protein
VVWQEPVARVQPSLPIKKHSWPFFTVVHCMMWISLTLSAIKFVVGSPETYDFGGFRSITCYRILGYGVPFVAELSRHSKDF